MKPIKNWNTRKAMTLSGGRYSLARMGMCRSTESTQGREGGQGGVEGGRDAPDGGDSRHAGQDRGAGGEGERIKQRVLG